MLCKIQNRQINNLHAQMHVYCLKWLRKIKFTAVSTDSWDFKRWMKRKYGIYSDAKRCNSCIWKTTRFFQSLVSQCSSMHKICVSCVLLSAFIEFYSLWQSKQWNTHPLTEARKAIALLLQYTAICMCKK